MIEYRDSIDGITPKMLHGFFVGWRAPHTPEIHLEILKNSSLIVLAFDLETDKVIGFITSITDSVQSAFIPLLEVLPDFQGRGVGSSLVKQMLKKLEHIPAIDLTCDPELQSFYEKLGMIPSSGMIIRNY
jgi:ribosomal protein S18 acetylase RimI-like enzyme